MFTQTKKMKSFICIILLLVVLSSMCFSVNANAQSSAIGNFQLRPVFAWNLGEMIYEFFNDIYQGLNDFSTNLLTDQLFYVGDKGSASLYITHDAGDGNNVQKWFDIFQIAGLMCIPIIAIKVGILLIGSFVSPEKRGELKDFIKTTMLVIIILLFAKTAVLMLIEINDAIVVFFQKAASAIPTPMLPKSMIPGVGSILAMIFAILMVLANLCLMIYVYIMLFIRKVIIAFAYMLIPIAAIMLYSKKFRGVLSKIYEELLAVIFQQAIFAGVYVILYDILLQVFIGGKDLAEIGKVGAFGAILGEGWFLQAVYVSYDGHVDNTKPEAILGPLGFAILLWLLIKVTKKIQGLFSLNPTYAPDAGSVISGAIGGVASLTKGAANFADVWQKTRAEGGKNFKERWNSAWEKGGIKSAKDIFKKGGFKNLRKGTFGVAGEVMKTSGRWTQRLGIPTAAFGMAAAGIDSLDSSFGKLNAIGENYYNAKKKFSDMRNANIQDRIDYKNKQKTKFDKKNDTDEISEQDLEKLGNDYYRTKDGLYAVKDGKGFKFYKRNENGELKNTDSKGMLKGLGLKGEAINDKVNDALKEGEFNPEEYGFSRFAGLTPKNDGSGKLTARAFDFKDRLHERVGKLADGVAHTSFLPSEFEELKHLTDKMDNIDAVVKTGTNTYDFLKYDRRNKAFEVVDTVSVSDKTKKQLDERFHLDSNDSTRRIAAVTMGEGTLQVGKLEEMNAVDTVAHLDAIDRATDKHQNTMAMQRITAAEANKEAVIQREKNNLKSMNEVSAIQAELPNKQNEVSDLQTKVNLVKSEEAQVGNLRAESNGLVQELNANTQELKMLTNPINSKMTQEGVKRVIGNKVESLSNSKLYNDVDQVISTQYKQSQTEDEFKFKDELLQSIQENADPAQIIKKVQTRNAELTSKNSVMAEEIAAITNTSDYSTLGENHPLKRKCYRLQQSIESNNNEIQRNTAIESAFEYTQSGEVVREVIDGKNDFYEQELETVRAKIDRISNNPALDDSDFLKQQLQALKQQESKISNKITSVNTVLPLIETDSNTAAKSLHTLIVSENAELDSRRSEIEIEIQKQNDIVKNAVDDDNFEKIYEARSEISKLERETSKIQELKQHNIQILRKSSSVGDVENQLKVQVSDLSSNNENIKIELQNLSSRNPNISSSDLSALETMLSSLYNTRENNSELINKYNEILERAKDGVPKAEDKKIIIELLNEQNVNLRQGISELEAKISEIRKNTSEVGNLAELEELLNKAREEAGKKEEKMKEIEKQVANNIEAIYQNIEEYEVNEADIEILMEKMRHRPNYAYLTNNHYNLNSNIRNLQDSQATSQDGNVLNDALNEMAQLTEDLRKETSQRRKREILEELDYVRERYYDLLEKSNNKNNSRPNNIS